MIARKSYVGAALFLTIATTAACGTVAEQVEAEAKSPKDELLASVPGPGEGAYRFDLKGNVTPISGVLDATKKSMQVAVSQSEPDAGFTLTITSLVVDKQSWMKIAFKPATLPGLPKIPKKWLLIDPAKAKGSDSIPVQYGDETDPGNVADIVRNGTGITEPTPGHFAGTTDLTGLAEAEIVDQATLTALGERAKTVPFEAVVDATGHVTSATLKVPAAGKAKAVTYRVTYSGYGVTKSPVVPAAGEQQKATATVYEMLNG